MKYWTTADGDKIEYTKLDDSHLLNIKAFIEKKAKDGVLRITGDVSGDADERWADEEFIVGKRVLDMYDYDGILAEISRRDIN